MSINPAGPILLEDYHLIEKLAQVSRRMSGFAPTVGHSLLVHGALVLVVADSDSGCAIRSSTASAFPSALCTPVVPVLRASSRYPSGPCLPILLCVLYRHMMFARLRPFHFCLLERAQKCPMSISRDIFSRHSLPPSLSRRSFPYLIYPVQVTHDISHLSAADVFRAPGVQTPLITRFSTVIHERGSPETLRDPRGFAVRPLGLVPVLYP